MDETKSINGKKKFYGWYVLAGCFLLNVFAASLISNTNSLYMNPVCAELGVDAATYSIMFTISSITSAVGAIILAPRLQKNGMKTVMLICAIGTGVTFALMGVAKQLWQMFIVFGLCNIFLSGLTQLPISMLITTWFTKKRGLAMGIAFCGGSLGGAVWNIVIAKIIAGSLGWRGAYEISALISAVASIVIIAFLIKQSPQKYGQEPYGFGEEDNKAAVKFDAWEGVEKKVAVKSSAFVMLAISLFFLGCLCAGVATHTVNFLISCDWEVMAAASVMSVYSMTSIVGNLAGGIIFEKLGTKKGTAAGSIFALIGVISLIFSGKVHAAAYIFAVFFGLSAMMVRLVPSLLVSEVFGTKDYGPIYSIVNVVFLIGCSLGSVFTGLISNAAGYTAAWISYGVASVLLFVTAAAAINGGKALREKYPNPVK